MEKAEREQLRQTLERTLGVRVNPREIVSLRTNSIYRWQPPLTVEVGKYCPHLEKDAPPMLVTAIFESKSFLVCTPEHGPEGTLPIIFVRSDVKEVVHCEDETGEKLT